MPTVRILNLPCLPPRGDAVQYVKARRAAGLDDDAIRAELERLADGAACAEPVETLPQVPVLVCLADVQPQPVEWLWPDRFALGKLTLIAGDPGLGKGLVTLYMAARVSRGLPWPDAQDEPNPCGGVVLLSAEDDLADTIRPRLDAAGADANRVVAVQAVRHLGSEGNTPSEAPFSLTTDLPALGRAIEEAGNCRLVVIDPVSAYLGGKDSYKDSEVRALLHPLSELAARHRVAVVAVTHLRKAGGSAMYRAMGSLAFVAAARAAWGVSKDKQDPQRRLMVPLKNNLAADVSGLAYTIRSDGSRGAPVVEWESQPITVTADEALAVDDGAGGGRSALSEAVDWLRDVLARGPVKAKDVKRQADDDGIAARTLDRAKAMLGVQGTRDGFGGPWVWRLPEPHSTPTPPKSANAQTLAHYGDLGALRADEASDGGRSDADGTTPGESGGTDDREEA